MKQVLDAVLTVVLIVLAGAATYAVYVLVTTMRSARRLLDDMDDRLVPLAENADTTLQVLNLELMRLDEILGQVESVTDTVESTTRAAHEAVQAPLQKAAQYAEKLRRFLGALRER